jgi:cytochrome c(L)
MAHRPIGLFVTALSLVVGATVTAQRAPQTRTEVARPGGTIPGAPRLALVKVADGFNDPTNVASAKDGSGRLFVVERVGRVKIVDKDGKVLPQPFLDLTKINPLGTDVQTGFVEQGLYAIAFHPNFRQNGYFYVHYASLPFNGAGVIVRFQVDPRSPDVMTPERTNQTSKVILRMIRPYYNHNGGEIEFGPDGYLYIASGDGGWEGDPLLAGQDLSTLLGKLLRLDVNTQDDDTIPYKIPPTNPFARSSDERLMQLFGISEADFAKIRNNTRREIWAYGVRNPYQFSFDPRTGDLYIADVGQNHWEEIDYQPAASKGGENYGWNKMEASYCHPMTGAPDPNCPVVGVLPAAEYPHENAYPGAPPQPNGSGCSIEGLGVANYAGMRSVYFAGDWCTGRLFGLAWDGSKWQFEEMLHTNLQYTAGGNGEDGYVYAVNCNCFYTADRGPMSNPPGALWKIVPASEVKPGQDTALTVQQITEAARPTAGAPQFRNALNSSAITLNKYPNETVTTKVLGFQKSGTNPFKGDRDAVAAGATLYSQWCASCHMPDATGRMGPNLVDDRFNHPRVNTDVGTFEVVYGGGTGAMQAFGDRLTQEEILKIMAFVDSLKKR